MLGKYGHSNLLYGYDRSRRLFYFFDPLYGGQLVKFSEVGKYLEALIMKVGVSIGRNIRGECEKIEGITSSQW